VREILNPALAKASTLRDASTVFDDLVLQFKGETESLLPRFTTRNSEKKALRFIQRFEITWENLGGSYSRASKGICVHETPTFPTCRIKSH
jgi:hypothetical protein